MSSKLGKIVADFRTSLATKISVGGTTASLQSNLDDDGIALPDGTYFFTIDGDSSQKEHIVATNTGGNLTDIKSISRQGVQTAGVKREHRVGAAVTITDFAHIKYLNDLLDGTTDLDGSKPLKYDIDPTISDDKHLVTKKYVGDAFSGVVGTASSTVSGTTKLSSDPVTPNNPVALNSEEVSATSGANKVPKANANGLIDSGFIIDNAADSGLEEGANGGTKVKVKTTGGILIDADGLSVDTTVHPATPTMPAYENLVAGDLLKTINDNGTYKLKKIVGIGALSTTVRSITAENFSFVSIGTNKIAYVYSDSNQIYTGVATNSGGTMTFGSAVKFAAVTGQSKTTYKLLDIKKIATDKYLIAYCNEVSTTSGTVYARVVSVSGVVATLEAATEVSTVTANIDYKSIDLIELEQDKFALAWNYSDAFNTAILTISGTTVTAGAVNVAVLDATNIPGSLVKLSSTSFVWFNAYNATKNMLAYVYTVSGTTITRLTEQIVASGGATISRTMAAVLLSPTKIALFWYLDSTLTTLKINLLNVSGTTITSIYNTTQSLTITNQYAQQLQAVAFDNTIYLVIKDLGTAYKYYFTDSLISYSSQTQALTVERVGQYLERYNNRLLYCNQASGNFYLREFLLDHTEFITFANASYTAGDNVLLVDRFTGFSGLANGLDYYINADASGLTIDSTYQKVGKAINDTTILK